MDTVTLAARFRASIEQAERALRGVTEEQAGARPAEGGWSRKEELGHLLDSAQNNHQRIAVAAMEGRYEGPGYAQNDWVHLHGYHELSWEHLLRHWLERNWMLGRVVARIPQERLSAPMRVGDEAQMTLGALVESYLDHMRHHVEHIARA